MMFWTGRKDKNERVELCTDTHFLCFRGHKLQSSPSTFRLKTLYKLFSRSLNSWRKGSELLFKTFLFTGSA